MDPRPQALRGGSLLLRWLVILWGCQEWRSFRVWAGLAQDPVWLSATLSGPQTGPCRLQEVMSSTTLEATQRTLPRCVRSRLAS